MIRNEENNFYEIGADLTLINAKCLQRISISAAQTKDFGVACSLNILAAEEALKAIFIILKHRKPSSDLFYFDKIFTSHSIKHDQLLQIIETDAKIQEINKETLKQFEIQMARLNQSKLMKTQHSEALVELNYDYTVLKRRNENRLKFDEITIWLKNANNDKNKGLYVDKQNGKWLTPQTIKQSKFEKEKRYTHEIIEYVSDIDYIFLKMGKSSKLINLNNV
jgi:AbiV family abortive infection protein